MWFELMTELIAHLEASASLKGVVIEMGGDTQIPTCKTVQMTRGQFQPKTNEAKSLNEQIIYLECWEFHEHEQPKKGYEKLAQLENAVMEATNLFGFKCISDQRIQVRLGQTEPDGDAFRPSVGSRTAVTIRWQ